MKKIFTIDVPELVAQVNRDEKKRGRTFTEENIVYAIERSGCILDQDGRIALTDPFKDDIHYRMAIQYPAYIIGAGNVVKPYDPEDRTIQIEFHFHNWKAAAYCVPKMTKLKMVILDVETFKTDENGCVGYPLAKRPDEIVGKAFTSTEECARHCGGNDVIRVKVGPPNTLINAIGRARLIPDVDEMGIKAPLELDRRKQPSVMEI